MADIGTIHVDQVFRKLVEAVEIVTSVCYACWLEAQPADYFLNGIEEYSLLTHRIRIIKTQKASPTIIPCETEVYCNGPGVAQVKKAIWLRWKTSHNFFDPIHANWSLSIHSRKKPALKICIQARRWLISGMAKC